MKLAEIEEKLNIKFPERWHKIYETGAMEYMELTENEFKAVRDKYLNDPKAFFMMLRSDCEPLFFEYIPYNLEEVEDWIAGRAEDQGLTLKENIRVIPFAMTAGGDMYCFLYENTEKEPQIVLFFHDDIYVDPDIIAENFDEFLYFAMLDAVSWDQDIEGEPWQAHMNYLSDEYKDKLSGKTAEELMKERKSLHFKQAKLFE